MYVHQLMQFTIKHASFVIRVLTATSLRPNCFYSVCEFLFFWIFVLCINQLEGCVSINRLKLRVCHGIFSSHIHCRTVLMLLTYLICASCYVLLAHSMFARLRSRVAARHSVRDCISIAMFFPLFHLYATEVLREIFPSGSQKKKCLYWCISVDHAIFFTSQSEMKVKCKRVFHNVTLKWNTYQE